MRGLNAAYKYRIMHILKINFGRIKKSCTFAIENEDIKVPALCFNMREAYREFGASRSLFHRLSS